jgi:predicted ATPase
MLTRLKVTGFKNLVDVDLRFGPFTCISGGNSTGKSNLFDAITFFGALADTSLMDASRSVRDGRGRSLDVHDLFHRIGAECAEEMTFEAEMIVPEKGIDDLGQEVKAKITFLRYRVTIGFRRGIHSGFDTLELLYEELSHINLGTASQHLLFPHKISAWRHSAVKGRRSGGAFISTQGEDKARYIELHTDGEGGGRPRLILAAGLPRTILSTVNTAEYPTALMARREMQSWRQLRLEPSALRRPDELTAQSRLGSDGSHLPAYLHHLHKMESHSVGLSARSGPAETGDPTIYKRLAAILSGFGMDVREIEVDHDAKRELLSLMLTDIEGTNFSARTLSDGALRLIAMAAIALDIHAPTLICVEEPENGICPEHIPGLLKLLRESAVDVDRPVDPDNPLRQVIITTHSPIVLSQIPGDCLIVTDVAEMTVNGRKLNTSRYCSLSNTWRHNQQEDTFSIKSDELPITPDLLHGKHNDERRKKACRAYQADDDACHQIQPSLPYDD